jgi:hypothetical protein
MHPAASSTPVDGSLTSLPPKKHALAFRFPCRPHHPRPEVPHHAKHPHPRHWVTSCPKPRVAPLVAGGSACRKRHGTGRPSPKAQPVVTRPVFADPSPCRRHIRRQLKLGSCDDHSQKYGTRDRSDDRTLERLVSLLFPLPILAVEL